MKNSLKTIAMWLIIGIIFITLVYTIMDNSDTRMSYSDLMVAVKSGNVKTIEIDSDGTTAYVTLNDSQTEKKVNIPSLDSFMNSVNENLANGAVSLESKSESIFITILGLLSPFGLLIIFFIFWFLFMGNNQSGGNKTMSFGKSRARMVNGTEKRDLKISKT